jgi:hypothetical protein
MKVTMISEILNCIKDKQLSTREIQNELVLHKLHSIKTTLIYLYKKGRVTRIQESLPEKPVTGPAKVYKYAAKKD